MGVLLPYTVSSLPPLSATGDVRAVDQPSSVDKSRDGWWRSMGRLPTAEPPNDAQVRVVAVASGKRGMWLFRRRGGWNALCSLPSFPSYPRLA